MTLNFLDVQCEYVKDKDLKPEDVKNLMNWVNQQPHLPQINELQAILFLQSCFFSNETAKTVLDTFFTVKTLCPDLFGMRNPLKPPMKNTMHVSLMTALPKETPDGYTILFMKTLDTDTDKFVFVDQIRYFDMISMLHLYQKGTSKGHIIVYDMKGISFGHLARLGPLTMKKLMLYLQDAMPVRLKGLHFLHVVPFMDKILALMRPFMKKELFDVLYLHNTVAELSKHIPIDCLPEEHGGSVGAMPILHEKIKNSLIENADFFEWEEKQKVDESRRPGKPKNISDIFGVEGTFKKLQID